MRSASSAGARTSLLSTFCFCGYRALWLGRLRDGLARLFLVADLGPLLPWDGLALRVVGEILVI